MTEAIFFTLPTLMPSRLRVGEIGGQQAGEMVLAVRENGGGVGYGEAAAEDHPVLPAARPLM